MLAPAVRGADPRAFAMVRATGIVSVALRQAGNTTLSAALLWIASAAFVVLVVASVWRTVAFPADVRGDLARPDRVFSFFAVPAAASVLAARVTDPGQHDVVAALTAFTALAWVAACCVVGAFLARAGIRRDGHLARRPVAVSQPDRTRSIRSDTYGPLFVSS